MSVLKKVVENIKLNESLNIDEFGSFREIKYGDWLYYTPYDKSITIIRIYPSKNISFGGIDLKIPINEIEELLGKYSIGYNWRDNFTRFTFEQFHTKFVKEIHFEKDNNISFDGINNQWVENIHRDNVICYPYEELYFNNFTIVYKEGKIF